MKIKITELEKRLGYKIKRNFKTIGFDTARICGLAFIRTDDDFAYVDWCYLEFENEDYNKTLVKMYKEFGKVLDDEDFAVIEEVFVGFSRVGSLHLAKMGTMAIAQCISKGIKFDTILAMSARSRFKINTRAYGKGKSKLAVMDWIKNVAGINITEDNCADALVLAFCGICEGISFKPLPAKKKTRKRTVKKAPVKISKAKEKAIKTAVRKVRAKSKSKVTRKQARKAVKKLDKS